MHNRVEKIHTYGNSTWYGFRLWQHSSDCNQIFACEENLGNNELNTGLNPHQEIMIKFSIIYIIYWIKRNLMVVVGNFSLFKIKRCVLFDLSL